MIDNFLSEIGFEKLADNKCFYLLTVFAYKKRYYLTFVASIVFQKTEAALKLKT